MVKANIMFFTIDVEGEMLLVMMDDFKWPSLGGLEWFPDWVCPDKNVATRLCELLLKEFGCIVCFVFKFN